MSNGPAWVQAITSVILILVTVYYVVLTGRLSKTAEKQLAAARRGDELASRAELREFAYLAKRLAEMVRALPADNTTHNYGGLMNSAALWIRDDLAQLGKLAARCGDSYAGGCVIPLMDLEWLRERTQLVKDTFPNTSLVLNNLHWPDWYARYKRTLASLDALCESAAAEASKPLEAAI